MWVLCQHMEMIIFPFSCGSCSYANDHTRTKQHWFGKKWIKIMKDDFCVEVCVQNQTAF